MRITITRLEIKDWNMDKEYAKSVHPSFGRTKSPNPVLPLASDPNWAVHTSAVTVSWVCACTCPRGFKLTFYSSQDTPWAMLNHPHVLSPCCIMVTFLGYPPYGRWWGIVSLTGTASRGLVGSISSQFSQIEKKTITLVLCQGKLLIPLMVECLGLRFYVLSAGQCM